MDWLEVHLIEEEMVLFVLGPPFAYFFYLFWAEDMARRIVRVYYQVAFLSSLVWLLHPVDEFTFKHGSKREGGSRMGKISFEEEVERTINAYFVILLEDSVSPVIKTWRWTISPEKVLFMRTMSAILFYHLQKWCKFWFLVSEIVHELFLNGLIWLFLDGCLKNCGEKSRNGMEAINFEKVLSVDLISAVTNPARYSFLEWFLESKYYFLIWTVLHPWLFRQNQNPVFHYWLLNKRLHIYLLFYFNELYFRLILFCFIYLLSLGMMENAFP